jgi:hypothetical protein
MRAGGGQKIAALARGVRLPCRMKLSKIINVLFLSAAIGWSGFSIAELILSKIPAGDPEVDSLAVVALASAAKNHELIAARHAASHVQPLPAIAAGTASPEMLPDPVAAGPVDAAPAVVESKPAAVEFEEADLLAAVQQGTVQASLRGNGRERITAQLRNNSPTPLRVTVPLGQVLEGGRNRVVVTRAVTAELMPARAVNLILPTAALLSSNVIGEAAYKFSYHSAERVEAFLQWASEHGGLTAPALQVVVLALTENLPLKALAKFAQGTPGEGGTDAFRAETGDLLAALTALRDCGGKMESFAIANDPQLRIEAMIEPLSREAAKRYYGITENMEWEFWKRELLEGSPSTRHYALFGIARFYPDVALGMLPKWAREPQTHPVYRLAAVQALADTQRPEALTILRALATELGPTTELGRTAAQSANYLDKRLTELAARTQVVAFRDKSRVQGL